MSLLVKSKHTNRDGRSQESRTSPFNAELKKTYEQLSGGITFTAFESIECQQIGELALAWSEGREPAFDSDPSGVLSKNPNEWNERFYIVVGDNPFISEARLRQVRAAVHTNVARLFRDVWGKREAQLRVPVRSRAIGLPRASQQCSSEKQEGAPRRDACLPTRHGDLTGES